MNIVSKKLFLALTGFLVCVVLGLYVLSNPFHTSWQDTVDTFASLVHAQNHIPAHLLRTDAVRTGDEFDVNRYFSVLTHLSMQAGYDLDYVYYFDDLGSRPILYARPIGTLSHSTYADYRKTVGSDSFQDLASKYVDYIQVDGTQQGFFELAVLWTLGDQFYLGWHANYNDAMIIADREALERLLTSYLEFGFGKGLPLDIQIRARFLQLEPSIEIEDDTVLVKFLIFTKWGGFIQESYMISRTFPHRIFKEEHTTLIEYDCGVNF